MLSRIMSFITGVQSPGDSPQHCMLRFFMRHRSYVKRIDVEPWEPVTVDLENKEYSMQATVTASLQCRTCGATLGDDHRDKCFRQGAVLFDHVFSLDEMKRVLGQENI